ncbi:MerR family transcriptional regulator [Candidatus Omnitrophota bacterium]
MIQDSQTLIFAKDISQKYRIPYSTVNHYTNLGFFSVVRRRGNKRLYDEQEIKTQLDRVWQLSNEGYPLRLIRKKIIKLEQG